MTRVENTIKIIFFVVGLALLVSAAIALQHTRAFRAAALRAHGEVIGLMGDRGSSDATFAPLVEYRAQDGNVYQFTSTLSSSPPSYQPGERVAVLYNPANPYDARIDSWMENWLFPVISASMGLICGGIGGGWIAWGLLRRRRRLWLEAHGTRVQARFTGVERNNRYSVNDQHPWRITCQWQDPTTGRVHVFQSDNLWYDPTEYITRDTVEVIIEPRNPHRYHVQTDFLPRSGA